MKNTISWEEWRSELEKHSSDDTDGWHTAKEIMEIIGKSLGTTGDIIRSSVMAGDMEAKKMKRINIVGDTHWTPCYRLKRKKK